MGSSAGRRSAEYVAYRKIIQRNPPSCCLHSGPWCTGLGNTVEHDPALSLYPDEHAWRRAGGVYRGACKPCQDRQGANLRNGRTVTTWTW